MGLEVPHQQYQGCLVCACVCACVCVCVCVCVCIMEEGLISQCTILLEDPVKRRKILIMKSLGIFYYLGEHSKKSEHSFEWILLA